MALAKLATWNGCRSARDKLKEPDNVLLDSITHLMEARSQVSTEFSWIKGHSGDRMNDLADQEANRARERGDNVLPLADVTSVQFKLGTKTEIIPQYPRWMLKSQARRAHDLCLLSSPHGRMLPANPIHRQTTVSALKSCGVSEPALYTSLGNSTFRAFRYKFIANLLPLGSRSKMWRVSNNPSAKCLRCQEELEGDLGRLFTCPAAREARDQFPERLKGVLENVWKEHGEQASPGFAAEWFVRQGLDVCTFTGVVTTSLAALVDTLPNEYLFIPTRVCLLRALWTIVYEDFWKPRCAATIEAERRARVTKSPSRLTVAPKGPVPGSPQGPSSLLSPNLQMVASARLSVIIMSFFPACSGRSLQKCRPAYITTRI